MYTLNSVFFRLGRSLDAQLVCLLISTPLAAGCSDGFFILGEKIRLRNSLLLLFDRLYRTHKTRSLFRPTLFGFFEAKVRGDLEEMLCVYFCGSRAVYEIMRRSEDSIVRNFHSFPITAIIGAFECGWRANTLFFSCVWFRGFYGPCSDRPTTGDDLSLTFAHFWFYFLFNFFPLCTPFAAFNLRIFFSIIAMMCCMWSWQFMSWKFMVNNMKCPFGWIG